MIRLLKMLEFLEMISRCMWHLYLFTLSRTKEKFNTNSLKSVTPCGPRLVRAVRDSGAGLLSGHQQSTAAWPAIPLPSLSTSSAGLDDVCVWLPFLLPLVSIWASVFPFIVEGTLSVASIHTEVCMHSTVLLVMGLLE